VSQGRFELPTFPLGGALHLQQTKAKAFIYWAYSPVVSEKTAPYSYFCTHSAPTRAK
jgi:hypothetical protein